MLLQNNPVPAQCSLLAIAKEESNENYRRAGYKLSNDHARFKNPIQIFTKANNHGEYRKCYPFPRMKKIIEAKTRKNVNRKRKNSEDDDYNIKNQKKDRNVTSNLIHHLIKFLTVTKGPKNQVEKMIKLHGIQITYQQFLEQLEVLSKNLRTYVTMNHIKQLWFSENPIKIQFCRIIRILSRIFFGKHGFLSVFFSNKFNNVSKTVHYKGLRNLTDVLIKKDLQQLNQNLLSI